MTRTPEQKAEAAAYAREYRKKQAAKPRPPEGTKQSCRICGVEKLLTEFYSNTTCVLGVDTQCKPCLLAKRKTPEQRAESAKRRRKFRKDHTDDPAFRERLRKEKVRAYWKDPEKSRNAQRQRWATNETFREGQKVKNKARYHSDPELRARMKEAQRQTRATPEGRSAHNASNSKWKKSEPGRLLSRMHAHVRRARIYRVPHDFTPEQWARLKDAYEGRCAYCKQLVGYPEMDHIVAIARGGEHTVRNIVPACAVCNRKKNDKPIDVALAFLGVAPEQYETTRNAAIARLPEIVAP